jgi:hypothetical protein
MDVHMRVGKGVEPGAVRFGAGLFSPLFHASWRLERDVVREHFRKAFDVVGVESVRPFLERFPRGHRHGTLLLELTLIRPPAGASIGLGRRG